MMSNSSATYIEYADTRRFSNLVLGYLSDKEALRPYYSFRPDVEGFRKAIEAKRITKIDRNLLVDKREREYHNLPEEEAVWQNIRKMGEDNTFSICTAHQPNILTGPVYFIYKIQHAIKLAEELQSHFPEHNFVPVYYMGSEDADLDELGHVYFHDRRFDWKTKQRGAVGRMKVDEAFQKMLGEMEEFLVKQGLGNDEIAFFRKHYRTGITIADATFTLVHELFGKQGLLVFNADDHYCKKQIADIFESDLFHNKPYELVKHTLESFPETYTVQTTGRPINLFYLFEDLRSRIEKNGDHFEIHGSSIRFSDDEMRSMLDNHPERFSPNVILRPLLQERLLPNIAFVGGGSELSYWMEFKNMFDHYEIPFPILLLRNSFSILSQKSFDAMEKMKLDVLDFFSEWEELEKRILERNGITLPSIEAERNAINQLYEKLLHRIAQTDKSLSVHTDALRHKAEKRLIQLEKKLIRAEKKKNAELFHAVNGIKNELFPLGVLQERTENYFSLQIKYGPSLISDLHQFHNTLRSAFCVLIMQEEIK